MELIDELGRKPVEDVTRVAHSRKQYERASRTSEIEHFEPNVLVHRDQLIGVRSRIAPRVLPVRARKVEGQRIALSQRPGDRLAVGADLPCVAGFLRVDREFEIYAFERDR